MAKKRLKTPFATNAEAIARYEVMDRAVREFSGQLEELEAALGMYLVGHHTGWKVLHFAHSKKTIKKYEEILGIRIIDTFPPIGPDAERSFAYKVIKSVSNFWKAVSGEEKVDLDRESRRSIE